MRCLLMFVTGGIYVPGGQESVPPGPEPARPTTFEKTHDKITPSFSPFHDLTGDNHNREQRTHAVPANWACVRMLFPVLASCLRQQSFFSNVL